MAGCPAVAQTCPTTPRCNGTPYAVPIVPPGVTSTQVNPCPPYPMGSTQPCCTVNVPVVTQAEVCAPPKPKKRCRYIQPPRPKSFKPLRLYKEPSCKMEDDTIYRKSYEPVEGEKPEPIRPRGNLCVGEGRISNCTVNKLSFQRYCNALPSCIIMPCDHKLLGNGPIQDVTTQKHDYVPKPYSRPNKIDPVPSLALSTCPLTDLTTNKLSYMPVDAGKVRVAPILPKNAISAPCGKFADNTIHKLSYQPWEMQERLDPPWARRPQYAPPTTRMEDDTVQKLSFMPPGMFVECAENDPNCIDCPDGFYPQPAVHQQLNCCQPCCCPKAAC